MLATVLQLTLALVPVVTPAVAPEAAPPGETAAAALGDPPPPVPEAPPPAVAGPEAAPAPAATSPSPAPTPAASVAAPSAMEAPPTDTPPASPAIELPGRRGVAAFVFGGALGVGGLALKIAAAENDVNFARTVDAGVEPMCIEFCSGGPVLNIIATPLLMSSVILVGSGMNLHGRWAAHRDVAKGRPPHSRRTTALMIGLGFGAVGAGVASWIASRVAMGATTTEMQRVAVRELGWWTAIAGVYAGAGTASYGLGYRAGQRKLERRRQVGVAPLLAPQTVGLGMAGRF